MSLTMPVHGDRIPSWPLLAACRPRQWSKNLLVFAVPLFALDFTPGIWIRAIGAFVCFCAVSAATYLFNDVRDVAADRAHPVKCLRPIAAGLVSTRKAILASAVLLTLSLMLGAAISPELALVLKVYAVVQVLYCLWLKVMPLLDMLCIAAGFLLRAMAGGVAAGQFISPWFFLTVGLLALFLAVEKRKAEVRNCLHRGVFTRRSLERYSLPLLMRLEALVTPCAFMSYSLWAAGPAVHGAHTSWMLFSVPFVLVGLFRYQLLSDPEDAERRAAVGNLINAERPEDVLLQDRGIQLTLAGWLGTVITVSLLDRWLG